MLAGGLELWRSLDAERVVDPALRKFRHGFGRGGAGRAGGIAVVVFFAHGHVEDVLEQVALAVALARAYGVRAGHDIATLGALAIGRHVAVVGAGVTADVCYVADHAHKAFRCAFALVKAERKTCGGIQGAQMPIQLRIACVLAGRMSVYRVRSDPDHLSLRTHHGHIELLLCLLSSNALMHDQQAFHFVHLDFGILGCGDDGSRQFRCIGGRYQRDVLVSGDCIHWITEKLRGYWR